MGENYGTRKDSHSSLATTDFESQILLRDHQDQVGRKAAHDDNFGASIRLNERDGPHGEA
jgi:hypothetical protein